MESTFIGDLKWPYFFWDGGGRELKGWGVDWTPLMFSGVEDHRGRWVRVKCLIRWKEQRSCAVCMMGMKQPDRLNWVGVQGRRQPCCAAFNSPGNTPISWKIMTRGCHPYGKGICLKKPPLFAKSKMLLTTNSSQMVWITPHVCVSRCHHLK